MGNVIILPLERVSNEEIEKLRKTLSDLVFKRDDLKLNVCVQIENAYYLEFGTLEYQVYEAYCEYNRLRRKRELIQSRVNKNEEIDIEEIEDRLDKEFQEYKEKLDQYIKSINDALDWKNGNFLSEEDSGIIKELYNKIVKLLHPDINPDISENEKELFNKAVEAYKNGDLVGINIIYELVKNRENKDERNADFSVLEKERLQELIKDLENEIQDIKSTRPYTLKVYIEDKKFNKLKHNDLNLQLDSFLAGIKTLEEVIKQILEKTK